MLSLIEHGTVAKRRLKQEIQSAVSSLSPYLNVPNDDLRHELFAVLIDEEDDEWLNATDRRYQRHRN